MLPKTPYTNKMLIQIEDNKLANFIILFYLIESLNKTIKTILPIPIALWSMISNVFMLLLAIYLFATISIAIKRSMKLFFLLEIIFVILFLTSILYGNVQSNILISSARQTLIVVVPLAIYFYSISDYSILYHKFLKLSWILVLLLSISLYLVVDSGTALYNMSLSYSLLMPVLFNIYNFMYYGKWRSFFLAMVGGTSILFFGARGPLLAILYMIVVILIVNSKTIKKRIYSFTILIVGILAYLNITTIAGFLLNFLYNKGLYSRTLFTLSQGSAAVSLSRDQLTDYYFDLINSKPISGWGILGGWLGSGNGPHNMLIESLLAFGYVGGMLFIITALSMMIRVFVLKESTFKNMYIIYSSYNIVMFFIMGIFHEKFNFIILFVLFLKSFQKYKSNSL